MPCCLFTYHGHATWMPDHPRGYVHRTRGLQPSHPHMAKWYRSMQREGCVLFTPPQLSLILKVARATGDYLDSIIHAITADPTHTHLLVS